MAEFKVIKTPIKIFPHPNAEKLELLKIGAYQAVVQKDVYRDGDIVIFAPEKSVLPDPIADDFRQYLRGKDKNRVGTIRLRGEISMGVIIPLEKVDRDNLLPLNEDIAEKLGIYKYEPPIPQGLSGRVKPSIEFDATIMYHDVEQFRIYADEFTAGETIRIWEKVHGSQGIYIRNKKGGNAVSSKGIFKQGLVIEESDSNTYWTAAKNMKLFELLTELYPDNDVQIFGEVIPVQKGFSYGCDKPQILFFKLVVDGEIIVYEEVPQAIKDNWVPLLYEGEFDLTRIVPLCENMKRETVSGQNLHIAEGGVVAPIVPRLSSDGFDLQLKIISKAYAKVEDEDAIA
jgi:RNA ligase (TIGR02306 family)